MPPSSPAGSPTPSSSDTGASHVLDRLRRTWSSAHGRWRGLSPYVRWPVTALAGLVLVLFLAGAWLWFTTDLPPAGGIGQSAVVLDRNGDELAILSQDGTRIAVELDDLPDHVPAALVAAEDRRYYEHGGVDPIGITRALWNNLTSDDLQGGSTITQQLVKNVYLDSDRTISRKVREAILAVKLERSVDKDQILQRYLNTVYFGRGAYGIEAAARGYFDRHASELDPAQAAMLVGMLRAPESFDPANDPDTVRARRDEVLDVMVDMGTLEPSVAESSKQEAIQVVEGPQTTSLTAGVAPHFIEQIRADVIDRFGEEALYSRGLVVHTTLDLADQEAAEAAVAAHLDDPDDPQAAVVGIDRSGAVRAWVGGRDFGELQLDLVSDEAGTGRQPGSTFKPIVLATNLAEGHGAGVEYAAPSHISLDVGGPEAWEVDNAGGGGYGVLTLKEATVHSVNTVYAQALLQVGPQAVVDMAHALGVSTELEPRPSIALGTEEIAPIELATVFSTLGRSGRRIDPFRISKVEDSDGDVLYERGDTEGEQVVEADVADTVSAVLSEVPRRGTATRAALDRPMAAKTGTTQRNADAWLAGYTPEYTAVVWVGNAESNEPMTTVDGERVYGGSVPAEIWHDFMAEALVDVPPTEFPDPNPELLGDTAPAESLIATDARVDPGQAVGFEARGVSRCISGWWVSVNGPTTPFVQSSPADEPKKRGKGKRGKEPAPEPVQVIDARGPTEASAEAGTTSVRLPADADEGIYSAALHCDAGAGGRTVASTEFAVGTPPSTTTTSSSSTTTSSTTTSSTSSSTTTASSTTSTSSTTAPSTTTTTTSAP